MKTNKFEEIMAAIVGQKTTETIAADPHTSMYWSALSESLGEEEAYAVLSKVNTAYAYAEYLDDVCGDARKAMEIEDAADSWFEENGYQEIVDQAIDQSVQDKLFGEDFDSEDFLDFQEQLTQLFGDWVPEEED